MSTVVRFRTSQQSLHSTAVTKLGRSHPKTGDKMWTFNLEGSARCFGLGLSNPPPCFSVLRHGRLRLRQKTAAENLALRPLQWLPAVTRNPACRLWVERHKTSTPEIEAVLGRQQADGRHVLCKPLEHNVLRTT